ncbi:hypothetical protein BWQ96_05529 [Gracilariopsis chorda]|uniref:Uncharacterized protein n=1 Tax=Gracilariopsis chorda TaxID=448386 RepID=A0A2V3IRC4_9FLOR|nr:hypothetical protein BWQ96_05529 [Gracilariopsis chorda]|eukprot:PXF44672.1 hypothetical protein BWQ96_05529 [Gracilariopsis chorda]
MTSPYGYAAFSAAVDYLVPHSIAVPARFFLSYPRFSDIRRFSLAQPYRQSLYKLTIPYAVVVAVLLLAALVANFYFSFKRAVVPGADDSNQSDPDKRDTTAKLYLLFSAFINFCILLCVALALVNLFVVRHAVQNVHLSVQGTRQAIRFFFQTPVDALLQFAKEAVRVDLSSYDPQHAVTQVASLFRSNLPHFRAASKSILVIFKNMNKIDRKLNQLSAAFFYFTLAVMLSVFLALACSLVCDITPPKRRRIRLFAFAFLLLPLLASWSHSAITTILAVATADFCASLQQYHVYINAQATESSARIASDNIFDRYGLTCPSDSPITQDALDHVTKFFAATDGISDFPKAFDAISDLKTAPKWNQAKRWMRTNIRKYKECEQQRLFAGKLAFHTCGDHPTSVASGMSIVWLCSCATSLLLTIVIALLTMGQPSSEFISARELLYVYGAPKLISVLEESFEFLKTTSNYQPWWKSRRNVVTDMSSLSSEETGDVPHTKNTSSDDEFSMSTDRARRNASYTSNSDSKVKRESSHWSGSVSASSSTTRSNSQ